MKHRLFTLLFLQLVSLVLFAGTVTTYPAPSGAPQNDDFTVRVRATGGLWQTVDTYAWNVDHTNNGRHTIEKSSVAYFDFTDKVEVEVTWNKGDVKTARVRPLSKKHRYGPPRQHRLLLARPSARPLGGGQRRHLP